jgi:hypothetical protein
MIYRPKINDLAPKHKVGAICECLLQASKTALESYGNMAIVPKQCEFDLESLSALLRSVGDKQLLILMADAKQCKPEDRNPFQECFLNLYPSLLRLRKLEAAEAEQEEWIASIRVAEWPHFHNLDQPCTRHDERTGLDITISLYEYLTDSAIFRAQALVILGETGFGKSQLANRWVTDVAEEMSAERGTKIFPLIVSSLDGIRKRAGLMRMGPPTHMEEMRLSDTVQVQYLSEEMVKILFDIRSGGQVHTRSEDIEFRPGSPRVWTSNASDISDFISKDSDRVPDAMLDSIRRRVWICKLSAPVLTDAGIQFLEAQSAKGSAVMSARMRSRMQAAASA